MPSYVKFMKEIMSKKKKLDSYGIVNLLENYSAIIQRELLEKTKGSRQLYHSLCY